MGGQMSAPLRIRRSDISAKAVPSTKGDDFKDYLERLLKMIPGEVVGLYLIGSGFIPEGQVIGLLIWTIICLIGVIAIRIYGTADSENNLPAQWPVVIISSIAFVIWIYSLGGVFKLYGVHSPYIGSLLVLAWTFFVPIFYKGDLE